MSTFLTRKHWQIFILIFGLPCIFQLAFVLGIINEMLTYATPDVEMVSLALVISLVVTVISAILLFAWFWSIGIGLQRFIPEPYRLKTIWFRFSLFFPIIYILFFSAAIGKTAIDMSPVLGQDWFSHLVVILPLHLLSMLCVFHNMYFVARTLKTAELQRKATFSDYVAEFFLLWVFPIGVWILQPRVNALVSDNKL